MQATDILETHIKPYLLEHLGDADAILLAGSHARVLNGETAPDATAKKNSDFDFVIFYDALPPRFAAAMFASQWMHIPGLAEPVSIDLKIIDRSYLDFHAQHTREVRRFPFLFSMILDAYPLHCQDEKLNDLRAQATAFIDAGPAPLGPSVIAESQAKLASLETALTSAETPRDHHIAALEGLQMLAGLELLTAQDWISPIGRNLVGLRQAQPGAEKSLTAAFNRVHGGDAAAYRPIARGLLEQLAKHQQQNNPDSVLLAQNITTTVGQYEINDSNRKGDKIMLGQYLARMKDAAVMDDLRLMELKCVLWLTAKSYLCRRYGETFAYGAKQAERLDAAADRPLLMPLLTAIRAEDVPAMYLAVNSILSDQGGVTFDYLERIYVEDLARRRDAAGITVTSAAPLTTPTILPPSAPLPPGF